MQKQDTEVHSVFLTCPLKLESGKTACVLTGSRSESRLKRFASTDSAENKNEVETERRVEVHVQTTGK